MLNRLLIRSFALAVLLVTNMTLAGAPAGDSSSHFQYGIAPPQGLGGSMALRDAGGQLLTEQLAGNQYALMTFVFSQCASTCPVSLALGKQILDHFDSGQAPLLAFVSLDPFGDDAASFERWLDRIDNRFVGLTGTLEQLETSIRQFGVAVQGSPDSNLRHSAVWYLLNADGQLLRVFPFNTHPEQIASDISSLSIKNTAQRGE